MNLIKDIKEYFSDESKAARFKVRFEQEYMRLARKQTLERLKLELKQAQGRNQATGLRHELSLVGKDIGKAFNFMAANYNYNSRPIRHKHKRRKYFINAPMGFALVPTGKRYY